jgi:hypothetical protein
MARPRRHVVVTLPPDLWDRLVDQAQSDHRDPIQQANWLLLRALEARDAEQDSATVPAEDVA